MGSRKVTVKQSVAEAIASIAWFIESKGMVATAEKFADDIYNYFNRLADDKKRYTICQEETRAALGYKCVPYKKKYTIVFIETDTELIICEFIASKMIYW